jgi:hypothetical protein
MYACVHTYTRMRGGNNKEAGAEGDGEREGEGGQQVAATQGRLRGEDVQSS